MAGEFDVRRLAGAELVAFGPRIAAIERGITYPLGGDRFTIDHGASYFRFFERLGRLTYVVAMRGETVVGAVAAMERILPGDPPLPVWYLGDLKVTTEGRGAARELLHVLGGLDGPDAGYAISMDPAGNAPNRVVRMLRRFRPELCQAARLHFYTADAAGMRALVPLLEAERGTTGFLSLRGVKDIVLASTGAPMPLLHAQFGGFAQRDLDAPQHGFVHMFCAAAGDALDRAVQRHGVLPMATATVLQAGLPDRDWSFVLTSDI